MYQSNEAELEGKTFSLARPGAKTGGRSPFFLPRNPSGHITSAVFLRASAPSSRASLLLSFCKPAQYDMKELAEHIISVGDLVILFSKQALCLAFHIAQHIAARPTMKNYFPFPKFLLSKPNIARRSWVDHKLPIHKQLDSKRILPCHTQKHVRGCFIFIFEHIINLASKFFLVKLSLVRMAYFAQSATSRF